MKIKNINGTAGNACKCGSWLDHWAKFSGQAYPIYCPEDRCPNKVEVGAHVQKDGASSDASWYIVPLCQYHNAKKGESLMIDDWVKLVSANVSETCGKQ